MSERPSNRSLLKVQSAYQLKMFFRSPMAAFFTLFFPLMIFLVFSLVFGNSTDGESGVTAAQYYAPAMAVFAAVSATYTNLAVTTAYQRDLGVLKRVRGTPLPSSIYMAGKIVAAVLIAVLAVGIMMTIGVVFYGVQIFAATILSASVTFAVGIATFAALGLLVAAVSSSGESATSITNATLLPLAFFSGVFIIPSADTPSWIETFSRIFPLKHFVEPFVAAFNPETVGAGWVWSSILYMSLWGVVAVVLSIRYFKWSPPQGRKVRRRGRRSASVGT